MRLTRAQAAARAALLELQSRPPLDPPALGAFVAETLRSAVGWDSHRLFTIDPASGAFSRLLESSAGDETSRAIWLRETYLGTESAMIATIERLAGASTLPRAMAIQADLAGCHGWPLRSWDDAEQRRFRELFVEGSERYRLPGRLSGAATLSPVANGVVVGHLVAWRLEPARPFSVGDIAFLNLVAGLVGELIETSIRADRQRPAEVPDGSGVVLLGPDGGLRYASPLGESWLRTLRGAEANVATDLPGQVWSAVAWLRTGAAQSSLHASVPGGEAVIQASSGGGDGSLALVIAPGLPAPAVQVPVAWRLTPAEARVATLVAQGLSNREVAERLSVSENTVVWHLRHVFATTGLTSRTQLAARVLRGSGMAGDG